MMNPVTATSNKERLPILKHCLRNSLNSDGRLKTSLKKRPANWESSPISSKKALNNSIILKIVSIDKNELVLAANGCSNIRIIC